MDSELAYPSWDRVSGSPFSRFSSGFASPCPLLLPRPIHPVNCNYFLSCIITHSFIFFRPYCLDPVESSHSFCNLFRLPLSRWSFLRVFLVPAILTLYIYTIINPSFCPQDVLYSVFVSNSIGFASSRSQHCQFYIWYFHSIPFLLWLNSIHENPLRYASP